MPTYFPSLVGTRCRDVDAREAASRYLYYATIGHQVSIVDSFHQPSLAIMR